MWHRRPSAAVSGGNKDRGRVAAVARAHANELHVTPQPLDRPGCLPCGRATLCNTAIDQIPSLARFTAKRRPGHAAVALSKLVKKTQAHDTVHWLAAAEMQRQMSEHMLLIKPPTPARHYTACTSRRRLRSRWVTLEQQCRLGPQSGGLYSAMSSYACHAGTGPPVMLHASVCAHAPCGHTARGHHHTCAPAPAATSGLCGLEHNERCGLHARRKVEGAKAGPAATCSWCRQAVAARQHEGRVHTSMALPQQAALHLCWALATTPSVIEAPN